MLFTWQLVRPGGVGGTMSYQPSETGPALLTLPRHWTVTLEYHVSQGYHVILEPHRLPEESHVILEHHKLPRSIILQYHKLPRSITALSGVSCEPGRAWLMSFLLSLLFMSVDWWWCKWSTTARWWCPGWGPCPGQNIMQPNRIIMNE